MRQTGEMIGETNKAVEAGSDPFGDSAEILGDLWLIRCIRLFFQGSDIPKCVLTGHVKSITCRESDRHFRPQLYREDPPLTLPEN